MGLLSTIGSASGRAFGFTRSAVAAAVDAYFNLTTLLLNTTATNGAQNNTFLDSSTNNFSITRNGNTTQGTFTPFSQTGWSNNFNSSGNTDAISFPSNAAYNVGTGNFTVEFWLNPTAFSGNDQRFFLMGVSGTTNLAVEGSAAGALVVTFEGSTVISYSWSPTFSSWYHIAACRVGSTVTLYINGTSVATATSSTSITNNVINVGSLTWAGSFNVKGYLSNVRFSATTAFYTSNFTPSTSPLTAISGTALLTCQSNRFVDNSSINAAVTVTGTPSVQAFSPFAPTIEYDTAVVGGSGYFDGAGDYLSVGSGTDFDFGTSDFSIEFWYWIPSIGTYATGLACKRQGGVATGWLMSTGGFSCLSGGTWYDSWGNPYWVGSSASTGFNASSSTTKIGQWTHVMVTRQGTDARWFVNGQLIGYQSRSSAIDQLTGSLLSIGLGGINYENPFLGYISNGRISIGSVPTGYQTSSTTLNTQVFTPPTSPVTTTSQGATSGNVKYIGNFINAGITDSTAKNDLETVGNAQVSTTQAKFGTTSMYFDGTGDYLRIPSATAPPLYNMGTGDYTVEMFVYLNTVSGVQCLIDFRGSDTTGQGVAFYLNGTTLAIYYSGSNRITFSPMTTGSWFHVCYVRSSGVYTMYVDGTSAGTWSNSDVVAPPANFPIIGEISGLSGFYLNGYIDELRITKGYARYTANFTPPAAAFPIQ